MGFASPQQGAMGSQGRPLVGPSGALPGSPFDGNIDGNDDFPLLGNRFAAPGSPQRPHGTLCLSNICFATTISELGGRHMAPSTSTCRGVGGGVDYG